MLPTGTVRTIAHGTVTALPGFTEGAWWVQDAAAALPARLLGDVAGLRVADLCAAPGGKTAQLHRCGAHVTAVDRSPARLDRLARKSGPACRSRPNWSAPTSRNGKLSRSMPCCSTRHVRRPARSAAIPTSRGSSTRADITKLAALQSRLLDRAVTLTKPGGTLVYCTCSLEPEEGEDIIAGLLAREPRRPAARRSPPARYSAAANS